MQGSVLSPTNSKNPLPTVDLGVGLPSGANALFLAVQCNNVATVRLFREIVHPRILEVMVNATATINGQQCSPLYVAALKNYSDIVAELVQFPGINLDAKNQNAQLTALYAAITKRNEDSACLLLDAGASWEAPEESDTSALHWAALLGSKRLVKALLEAKPKPHPFISQEMIDSGKYQSSAVMRSAYIGDFAIVQLFIDLQRGKTDCLEVVSSDGMTVEDILGSSFGVGLLELEDIVEDLAAEEAEAKNNPDQVDEAAVAHFYDICTAIEAPKSPKKSSADSDDESDDDDDVIDVVQAAQLSDFLDKELQLRKRFESNWKQFVQFELRRFATPKVGHTKHLTLEQFCGAAWRRWSSLREFEPDPHYKIPNRPKRPQAPKSTGGAKSIQNSTDNETRHEAAKKVQKVFRGARERRKLRQKVSVKAVKASHRHTAGVPVTKHAHSRSLSQDFENESFDDDETSGGSVSDDDASAVVLHDAIRGVRRTQVGGERSATKPKGENEVDAESTSTAAGDRDSGDDEFDAETQGSGD